MVQPIDYSLNLPNPSQRMLGNIAMAKSIQGIKTNQANAEVATQQRAQLQQDLNFLYENPNPSNVARMMVKHPQLNEQFRRAYDVLDREEQKERLNQATEVYSALAAGEHDIARDLLNEKAEAYINSGMEEEAKTLTDLARLIELNPDTAKTSTGLFLASAMGPDKFTETFSQLESQRRSTQLEESELTKREAEAYKAAVSADFAESEIVADLQKKGWDIQKIQTDIDVAKHNKKIAVLNAQLKSEENQLKRDELKLKIEENKRERDEKIREKTAEAESTRGNVDNMLNTVDRILDFPTSTLNDALGAWDGSWIGKAFDAFDQDVQDFAALTENLGAQAFLTQVPQMTGMGALSENEGKQLAAALQSFNRKQSMPQFVKNLKEAQRLMLKARENVAKKYGIPETLPDRPSAQQAPSENESQRYRMVRDTETGKLFPMPIYEEDLPVVEETPDYSQYQEGQVLESQPQNLYPDDAFQIISVEE